MLATGQAGVRWDDRIWLVRITREVPQEAPHCGRGRHELSLILAFCPEVAPRVVLPHIATLTGLVGRALCGAGQVTGATKAPLDLLLGPFDGRNTYQRSNTTTPHRSLSIFFYPYRRTDHPQVIRRAASHSLAVPALIGDC